MTTTTQPPLPSPPFISIPGIQNFRDTGGYPLASDPRKVVRRGVLYRAAEPSQVTPEGITRMSSSGLGIKYVYDLRSVREFEKEGNVRPPTTWEGSERIFAPVFLDEDYSPEAVAMRFRSYASGPEVSFFSESSFRFGSLVFCLCWRRLVGHFARVHDFAEAFLVCW